jgi:hypothetical protein
METSAGMGENTPALPSAQNVVAVLVANAEAKKQALAAASAPIRLSPRGIARFWLVSARRLETENCLAFFHKIETIARNCFQVG